MQSPFSIKFDNLPESLPVFPLPSVLLLPGGRLPLNIFAPRYISMILDSLSEQRLIGVVQTRMDAKELVADNAEVFNTGCVGRIVSFTESSDGRLLITLDGSCRFNLLKELEIRNGYRRFNDHYENGALNGSMLLKTKDEKVKILFNGTRRKTKYNFPTNSSGSVDHQYAKTARDRRHMTIRSLNFEYKFYDSLTYGTTYKYNYLHKWAQNSTVQVSTDLNWWEKREGFDYYMKSNNDLGVFNMKIGYAGFNFYNLKFFLV